MYSLDDHTHSDVIKEIFSTRVLSLLGNVKLDYIISKIRISSLQNILEIGTFAGGTAYILAKNFPNKKIYTIDVNKFDEYFKQLDHYPKILGHVKNLYPEIEINEDSIVKIQNIYKSLCSNTHFLQGDVSIVDFNDIDCVIIDGDHSPDALLKDLNYTYNNMKQGLIFVDDCVYPYIAKTCKEFCRRHNLDYEFSVYCSYNNNPFKGFDICLIKKN